MSRSNIEEVLPLAPLQEGLLFHALLDDTDDVYTVRTVVDLDGAVDAVRLREAAEALVQRHAVLRTAFVQNATGAVQVVLRRVRVPWAEVDLRTNTEPPDEPFVLDKPPLIRFLLARTGDTTHRLVITSHHILLDGWSGPLLLRDLFALYSGTPLPRVRPYRDFLAWLSKRDKATGLKAWADLLDGVTEPTLTALPATGRPQRLELVEPEDLSAAVTELARRAGVTVSTVLHAAWGILVGSLTGRDDVVFGATVSGRPADLSGVDSMVGLFINTIPVRVRLNPWTEIPDLLRQLHRAQTSVLDHHHLNLGEIQAAVGVGDLFDTLVVVETYPVDDTAIDTVREAMDVRATGVDTDDATHYPLTLTAEPGAHLTLGLEHRLDGDHAASIGALLLSALRDLTRVDYVGEVNHPPAPPRPRVEPRTTTLLDLFAEHADSDEPAVACGEVSLTFRELDAQSTNLARYLVSQGVDEEDRVAVVLPRSVDVIVSMFAVWKAGAVVVPVDPAYPADRIAATLAAARPVVVIDNTTPPASDSRGWLPGPVSPDSAAYIVFTSGSTGRPKGVVATHGGVANLALAHRAAFIVQPRRFRALNLLSFAFDGSVDPLLWLFAGHTVHVLPDHLMGDSPGIVDYCTHHSIDFVDAPPSLLELLVADGLLDAGISVIATGAEAVSPRLWNDLAAFDGLALNLYGPTECTVDATWAVVTPGQPHIGKPITGADAVVLDSALRPVAIGVPGELYMAGAGVARGYDDRPGETATRFIADPYGTGDRLYRTGDLVRRTAEGTLEFLGRADDQVKIRGHRVEPGEVEAALLTHPTVRQAAVIARTDAGVTRLVGYVTPADADPADLRAALARTLPDHLVPAAIVAIDTFPATPNGKLDRRALPAPQYAATAARAPRTRAERVLCDLYAELLGLPEVGVDDSFFAHGGHSLLAARLISRIRADLDATPGLRAVFDAPTPAALAARLDATDQDTAYEPLLPLRPVGTAAPLFCVHPGLGLSWSYTGLLAHIDPDIPVYGLQATGFTEPVTVDEVADRYAELITAAAPTGPVRLLGWSLGAVLAHAIACRLDRVTALVLLDGYPGGDEPGEPGGESRFLHEWLQRAGYLVDDIDPDTMTPDRAAELADTGLLTGLGADRISALATSMRAVANVDTTVKPDLYVGDALLVRATPGGDPTSWEPYIAGQLTTHTVDVEHESFLTSHALRVVGPLVAAVLRTPTPGGDR
ncbi:non-ribosomal peptide synthetase [Actinokineospora terrae]|uniref:Amino acid adenylation domain-containing protein n=1 Tax=Actinokineospora terrae TaxID=155974 RepID=A0A1H9X2Z8_9PSEU|nr:non-ribosomal peptide synthetase [Actinokineospora terrae]SES40401.1 amino acid adenylation domain-containing protein [Actinokineospora terrae]